MLTEYDMPYFDWFSPSDSRRDAMGRRRPAKNLDGAASSAGVTLTGAQVGTPASQCVCVKAKLLGSLFGVEPPPGHCSFLWHAL
jgi:hypothetical protein